MFSVVVRWRRKTDWSGVETDAGRLALCYAWNAKASEIQRGRNAWHWSKFSSFREITRVLYAYNGIMKISVKGKP